MPAEFKEHAAAAISVVLEELRNGRATSASSAARARELETCSICRWLGKSKWAKRRDKPSGKVRVIRMTLTLRGLEDADADTISTLASATGEEPRDVNFELTPDATAILRQIPEFSDFDPS